MFYFDPHGAEDPKINNGNLTFPLHTVNVIEL